MPACLSARLPVYLSVCRLAHAEASYMDPQSRILLEQTHLSLIDAGSRIGQPVASDAGV